MSGSTTDVRQSRGSRSTADRLDGLQKSLPAEAEGGTVADFLAGRPRLSAFSTPLLVLDDAALDHNTSRMAGWCAERGVGLAPHGKTTMAPALWRRQLDAGAWGITVATGSQLWVAVAAGVSRVLLANALVDPVALVRLAGALDADPGLDVLSWVDSVDTVTAMAAALAAAGPVRPVSVLVELGAPGGRTGARDQATAHAVAAAVAAAPQLALAGVAGYEGALAHEATPAALAAVRAYLRELAALHAALRMRAPTPGRPWSPRAAAPSSTTWPTCWPRWRTTAPRVAAFGRLPGRTTTASTAASPHWRAAVRRASRSGRPCTPGPGSSPGPSPGWPCWMRASATSPTTWTCRSRSWPPSSSGHRSGHCRREITAVNDQHAFLRLDPADPLRVGARGPVGPVAPVHRVRQVALDPGRRGR